MSRGGPSVLHHSFLRHLQSDFSFHVVVSRNHHMIDDFEEVAAGVHLLPELPTMPRSYSPVTVGRYLAAARRLSADLAAIGRRTGARLVWTVNEVFPPGPMAARRLGVPAVTQVLGMKIFSPIWLGPVWSRVLRRTADHVVACQDVIAEKLERSGVPSDRITVVYNAVDVDEVRRRAKEREVSLPGDPSIGMVAGMDPRKGHLGFVQAAAQVAADLPQAHFYVIGSADTPDPAYGQAVRAEIGRLGLSDRFHLLGHHDNPAPWIAALDIYVNSSLSEAMPLAAVEASVLERPIVASNVGGNHIIVVNGETGLLARPDDPVDLAGHIVTLARDAALRRRLGTAAARRAEARFAMGANAALLRSLFTELSR